MTLTAQYHDIQNRIAAAAVESGRARADVTLIAVSKQQPEARITAMLEAGQRVFGENRVQEAKQRWTSLRAVYPDLALHLIGPLQTNKVRDAVALFDVIHTVDRESLALALAKEMQKQNRPLPCLIQVNTGLEPQKSGIAAQDLPAFHTFCRGQGLNIIGLMCIPPVGEQAALHFGFLLTLARQEGLAQLSMGMSEDFETAIAFGATMVRVGSALFGARD